MKTIAISTAAAALLTLAGCNQVGRGDRDSTSPNNSAAANTFAGQPGDGAANQGAAQSKDAGGNVADGGAVPAPLNAGAAQLDRPFMFGRWTETNDCSNFIEFFQDGRVFFSANSVGRTWNLAGDRLTFRDIGESQTVRLSPVNQNTITMILPNGSRSRMTRC